MYGRAYDFFFFEPRKGVDHRSKKKRIKRFRTNKALLLGRRYQSKKIRIKRCRCRINKAWLLRLDASACLVVLQVLTSSFGVFGSVRRIIDKFVLWKKYCIRQICLAYCSCKVTSAKLLYSSQRIIKRHNYVANLSDDSVLDLFQIKVISIFLKVKARVLYNKILI